MRGLSPKRQRRFVKYQARIEECGQDIEALGRFVDAQVTAFRKILKKYKVSIHPPPPSNLMARGQDASTGFSDTGLSLAIHHGADRARYMVEGLALC
jgi:hypothetical protein